MAKVAAVILADDARGAEREARAALSKGADLVELRLDVVRNLDSAGIRNLAGAVGSKAIATLRSEAEGGAHGLGRERRASLLNEIMAQRFAYVDIERDADGGRVEDLRRLAKRHRPTIVVSHHFTAAADPSEVQDALEACAAIGDIAKVAAPVADVDSAIQLVDMARNQSKAKKRVVLIGTGIEGMITRALAEEVGQELQYAAWGRQASPGQLTLAAAARLRGREPMVLGLVGHPLGHSLSPAIHEAALSVLDVPGVYLPFDCDADSLDSLLEAAERDHVRGFNVTSPHKETIVEKLDELDGDAERLGAVNTVVIGEGWTKGHNTDVFGFRLSLRSLGLRVGDRRVLVVGAGGAAKAVVDVLVREGAKVQVTNRTMRRAAALADSFDESVEAIYLEALARGGPWDYLVNATPLGTQGVGPDLPVPASVLARVGYVYDLVYNPPTTPLLEAARRLGKPTTSGLDMLVHQAAQSFELWTGRAPPVEPMRRAAKEALR
jgi:shikimate dehydrogenase/3-dehydroquinate dehydratase type I